jgi:mannosyltransferase OCH1-like enzyme
MWVLVILAVVVLVGVIILFNIPSTASQIPKIIHQTAPADKSKWHALWAPCQESWKTKFPDYTYMFWSDEDLENLIKTKYPWFYDTYKNYDKNIKRIDAARYFILYEHGGIYADMDFECVNNFAHLIPQHKVSIAESPYKDDGRDETHQNALMISPPKHPFWEKVFKLLDDHKNKTDVLYATGPQIIVQAIRESDDSHINTLESSKFAPPHDETFKSAWRSGVQTPQAITDMSIFTRHHGTGVWGVQTK